MIGKPYVVRILTEPEIAWFAAALDGEGSLGYYRYKHDGRRVLIAIYNTNELYVKKAKEIVGCGFIYSHPPIDNKKRIFIYQLKSATACLKLLPQLLPWLIIKKQKAVAIIDEFTKHPPKEWTAQRRIQTSDLVRYQWTVPSIRKSRVDGMHKAVLNGK